MGARVVILALGAVSVVGCTDPLSPAGPRRVPDAGYEPSPPVDSDLPCDVVAPLATHCWTCHGPTPAPGVPTSLVTRADLTRPSALDPAMTYAERSVVRMRAATSPMPPAGARMPDADIARIEAWIAGGAPGGTCTVEDPWQTPIQCSSGRTWTRGDDESPEMHPGGTCVSCHAERAPEKSFYAAGTVYPSAHEPDDCSGADTGGTAIVEITDAAGRVFRMAPNRAGNFFLVPASGEDVHEGGASAPAFATPYTARVLFDGRERAMLTPQTVGECNACHTLAGAGGAPGRIVLP